MRLSPWIKRAIKYSSSPSTTQEVNTWQSRPLASPSAARHRQRGRRWKHPSRAILRPARPRARTPGRSSTTRSCDTRASRCGSSNTRPRSRSSGVAVTASLNSRRSRSGATVTGCSRSWSDCRPTARCSCTCASTATSQEKSSRCGRPSSFRRPGTRCASSPTGAVCTVPSVWASPTRRWAIGERPVRTPRSVRSASLVRPMPRATVRSTSTTAASPSWTTERSPATCPTHREGRSSADRRWHTPD